MKSSDQSSRRSSNCECLIAPYKTYFILIDRVLVKGECPYPSYSCYYYYHHYLVHDYAYQLARASSLKLD
jgi:hypothetical protein